MCPSPRLLQRHHLPHHTEHCGWTAQDRRELSSQQAKRLVEVALRGVQLDASRLHFWFPLSRLVSQLTRQLHP